MTGTRNTWAIGLAAATLTTALIGGVALAAIQPFAATEARGTVHEPVTGLVEHADPNKLKAALDALVAKGTITRAQADAIVQALKDGAHAPKPPVGPRAHSITSFIGDLTRVTATYLGISEKDLGTQLRAGKSVADVATGLKKSTSDLTALLVKSATEKIDQAVAANKLTADQATALKAKVAAEVAAFLQRSFKPH